MPTNLIVQKYNIRWAASPASVYKAASRTERRETARQWTWVLSYRRPQPYNKHYITHQASLLRLFSCHILWRWLAYQQHDQYSGQREDGEQDGEPGTPENEIWRKKCRWRASGTSGGRWRWKHKMEMDGGEWYVDNARLGVTRHKSCTTTLQTGMKFYDVSPTPTENLLHYTHYS